MDRRGFGRLVTGVVGGIALPSCTTDREPRPGATSPNVSDRSLRGRVVERILPARRSLEGAGFPVRRPFPTQAVSMVDPFVLLDEMGPVDWAPGAAKGAPDHPHRGFETVTYLLDGGMEHKDSLGNKGRLEPGSVQWMTAGAGIVHSEMPARELLLAGGPIHGFQLWVNLPARDKWVEPRYQEPSGADLPRDATPDGRAEVRVIAGSALGARARIETHTPMEYHHWTLRPGGRAVVPVAATQRVCLFVFRGACLAGESRARAPEGSMAVLGDGDAVRFEVAPDATGPAELLLLAGAPIGEPVARGGPFVMNTNEEIQQAFADYRSGKMGAIPPG